MKKLIIFLLPFLLLSASLSAQQKTDVRTLQTKVADLLMKFPPQNSANLNDVLKELADLGGPAITNIASKLVAPGKGNDAAMRYAISGLTKFLGASNDRNRIKTASMALVKAITTSKNDEVKDFLMQELQYVAGDEAVPVISKYLLSKRLSDPASRILSRVNTHAANNALMNALTSANGQPQLSIIKALGDNRYAPAQKKLQQLATHTANTELKKVLLRSLANIGNVQSAGLLESAAKQVLFQSEPTDAAGSYLTFLQTLIANNNKDFVEKAAKNLLANATIPEQIKGSALTLLTVAKGPEAAPDLLAALNADSKKYRVEALSLLAQIYSPGISTQLQKIAKTSTNNGLISELISLMGDQKDKTAVPLFKEFLSSGNAEIRDAAIGALSETSNQEAITPLINLLKVGGPDVMEKAKNTLLTIKGENLASAAAEALPQTSGAARIVLIDIIAQRGAEKFANLIFSDATGTDGPVRLAAAKALPYLVTGNDTQRIAGLLNQSSNAAEIGALQQALFSSIKSLPTKLEQVGLIKNLMQNAGANQSHYYNVLANVAGPQALEIVVNNFNSGNQQGKEIALNALSNWSDFSALDALYKISKDNTTGPIHDQALNSFISGINKAPYPVDQKVLLFRKAMEQAADLSQKKKIINGLAQNSNLQSLLFVSKYFDDPQLQQTAISAVSNIVLSNNDLYGDLVEKTVQQAISLNKDPEALYAKQELMKHLATLPKEKGYTPMFNGKDLAGWKGLVENPIARAKMSTAELATKQIKADEQMRRDWKVENGVLVFEGSGYDNLVSDKMYEDFDLILDWRMQAKGDGGVYLRGSPQVQTWDTSRVDAGAQVGSGGLYNNQVHQSKPLLVADNPINEWNSFRIRMVGDKVTVYLNGQLVTNNVILENYWDRKIPIFDKEAIELQAHGTRLEFRDVYVREIPRPKPYTLSPKEKAEGFVPMFNGINLDGWIGNKVNYYAEGGTIVSDPTNHAPKGTGNNIYTEKQYSDFIMRFEFQLTPEANNGLGIRTPTEGDAAYAGMELQILDNEAAIYKDLHDYQYHGSVYGVIPALRGYLKPVGEWNYEEVKAIGNHITVSLNGKVILDGDIAKASKNNTKTADGKPHPGLLNKTGHIGFLGHGSPLKFRNLRIRDLGAK